MRICVIKKKKRANNSIENGIGKKKRRVAKYGRSGVCSPRGMVLGGLEIAEENEIYLKRILRDKHFSAPPRINQSDLILRLVNAF